MKILEYYSSDGTHKVFTKYMIYEDGVITNVRTGRVITQHVSNTYNVVSVYDEGRRWQIHVARALASTFLGKPLTKDHTADHIDRNRLDDTLDNIRWANKSEQINNRTIPDVLKSACVIEKDGVEHTSKEWTEVYKRPDGKKYTSKCIENYARIQKHGFRFKTFPSLRYEIWKPVKGSKNSRGEYHISSRSRIKYVTKHSVNVMDATQLHKSAGYPVLKINGKNRPCHELSFMTFRPKEYAAKEKDDIVLHRYDNKLDFSPFRLRLGTQSENRFDAHDNGKYDGSSSTRKPIISYIDGVFERKHSSLSDAVRYLKDNGYSLACITGITAGIDGGKRYNRYWKLVT